MQPDAKTLSEFEKLGIEPPNSVSHGATPDDIREKLIPANPRDWRLEGNLLHCMTDHGPLAQTIDPSYILRGIDDVGLPILTKVKL